ncbi:tetratricopeptide repeat protein [candidate division CSSED10-310 bacterium]|uniref:Tetratricopeptide repeat protein n=1 Tax=candidate division CSSED10-310 bacterium TaxID=2855610 RepID=A0ABV6Z4M4_UNCC1
MNDLPPLQQLKRKWITSILWLLLLYAVVIRVFFVVQIKNTPFQGKIVTGGDSVYYQNWANRITTDLDPVEGAFFMSPLYPYLLAALFALGGESTLVVRIFQHVLGLMTILLTFRIGTLLGDRVLGLLAATLLVFSPVVVFYEGLLLLAAVLLFLITLFIFLLLRFQEGSFVPGALLPGFFLGVTAIGRGNVLLFIPFIIIWFYLTRSSFSYGPFIKKSLMFLLGISFAISPVAIRNYIKEKSFTLITTNMGLNFYIGNNHESRGTYDLPDEIRFIPGEWDEDIQGKKYAERVLGKSLTSQEVSSYWFQKGLQFWKKEPAQALKNYVRKIMLFWNRYEIPQIENFYFYRIYYVPVLKFCFIPFAVVGPLSLIGLVLMLPYRKLSLVILLVVVYSGTIALFFITARYRIPLLSLLVLPAAFSFRWLITALLHRKWIKSLVMITLFGLIYWLLGSLPFDMKYTFAQQYNQAGFLFYKHKMYDEAREHFQNAIAADPSFPTAYRNLADVFQSTGDREKALENYQRSLELNKEDAVTHFNMGYLYHKEADYEKAESHYRQAIELDHTFSMAFNNLALLLQERGDLKTALKLYERALETDKKNHRALNNLGQLVHRLGLLDEAAKLFQKAHQENPSELRYQINWLITEGELGQHQKSYSELEKILPLVEDSAMKEKCTLHIIRNLMKLQKNDAALHRAQKFLALHPDSSAVQKLKELIENKFSGEVDKEF